MPRNVDGARDFVFAHNAAPPETHRDPDLELQQLTQRLAELEAKRAQEQAEANTRELKRLDAAHATRGRPGWAQRRLPVRVSILLGGFGVCILVAGILPSGDSPSALLGDSPPVASKATLALPGSSCTGVSDMAFSPDGKTLATSADNSDTYLWNPATGKITATLTDGSNTFSSFGGPLARTAEPSPSAMAAAPPSPCGT